MREEVLFREGLIQGPSEKRPKTGKAVPFGVGGLGIFQWRHI
jgi:hypothetical protein